MSVASTSPPEPALPWTDVTATPTMGRRAWTVSTSLVAMLEALGVEHAFGISGGAIVPIFDALRASNIITMHYRHEAGAAFAATESSLASGKPAVVFVTTGPGITNALTGLAAARSEGARVILVSAATAPNRCGRGAFQETDAGADALEAWTQRSAVFHLSCAVNDAAALEAAGEQLRAGLQRPQGFVAHLRVPTSVQSAPASRPHTTPPAAAPLPVPAGATLDACVELLAGRRFVIWAGFGARAAAADVVALARHTGAPVMCSPRGKGVFPEDAPQYVGVTGFAGHDSVGAFLAAWRPEVALVLGSRLGEFTSFWDAALVPPLGLIHVDVDAAVFGAAFPGARSLDVQADVGATVRALRARLAPGRPTFTPARPVFRDLPRVRRTGTSSPQAVMAAVQRVVVDQHRAWVMTEAGNAFAWGNRALCFSQPHQFRVSMSFGAMGHAVCGVLGAALARRGKAVALAGDGAMLMNSEVSTAAQYGIPAVWVVLNDAGYGMIRHGMHAYGYSQAGLSFPRVDFAAMARAMGAAGVRVEREMDLDGALQQAMAAPGPFVVDIDVDPDEAPPFLSRVRSLSEQGVATRERET